MFVDFSGPLDFSDEADEMIRLVATEHYRAVGEQFLDKFGALVGQSSLGLLDCIADGVSGDLSLSTVWRPSFGIAKRALLEERVHLTDPATIAVELALAFGSCAGRDYDWSFSVPKPTCFAVGRYVVAVNSKARIRLNDTALQLEQPDAENLIFRRDANELRFEGDPAGIEAMPQLQIGDHQVVFASESCLDGHDRSELPFAVSKRGEGLLSAWSEAYSMIAAASPDYMNWVTRAIRSIIPLQAPSGSMVSGSQGHRPGEVYMTDALDPIKLAEMLVHEASHQYFQIASFLGPVQDGSDAELYYSPVVEKSRPVEKILLAYHAFANVILFLRSCQDRGIGDSNFLKSNLSRLSEEVSILQKPLETSRGLTEIGNDLWRPLAERLRHAN